METSARPDWNRLSAVRALFKTVAMNLWIPQTAVFTVETVENSVWNVENKFYFQEFRIFLIMSSMVFLKW